MESIDITNLVVQEICLKKCDGRWTLDGERSQQFTLNTLCSGELKMQHKQTSSTSKFESNGYAKYKIKQFKKIFLI